MEGKLKRTTLVRYAAFDRFMRAHYVSEWESINSSSLARQINAMKHADLGFEVNADNIKMWRADNGKPWKPRSTRHVKKSGSNGEAGKDVSALAKKVDQLESFLRVHSRTILAQMQALLAIIDGEKPQQLTIDYFRKSLKANEEVYGNIIQYLTEDKEQAHDNDTRAN